MIHCSYEIKDDKKHGMEWEYFPGTSQPKICLSWEDDKIEGQVKTWYENGQQESQREIHDNKKQGLGFAWYKNGDLMLSEEYEQDKLIQGSYYKRGDKTPLSKIESGKGSATLHSGEGIFLKKISYDKGIPVLYDELLR